MNRKRLALLVPPAAVMKHGCATCTAGPISVLWLTSLVGLVYGLLGGTLGDYQGSTWLIIGLSLVLWIIATIWALTVMSGVQEDIDEPQQGSLKRRVVPQPDEPDSLKQVRGMH